MGKYKMTSHRGRRDVEKFREWKLASLAQSDTDLARVEYEASKNAPTPDVSTLTLARWELLLSAVHGQKHYPSNPPTCYPGGNVFITPLSASWCYDGERNAILLAHRLATLRDSASQSGSNRTTSHAHVLHASLLGALSKPLSWVGNKTQSRPGGYAVFFTSGGSVARGEPLHERRWLTGVKLELHCFQCSQICCFLFFVVW